MIRTLALLVLVVLVPSQLMAQEFGSTHHRYKVTVVADGLSHPWSLAFLPTGEVLVTERDGRLRMIRDGRLLPAPLAGLPPIRATGQGGLLDLAPHPDFADNRLLYFSYAADHDGGLTTHVARSRLDGLSLQDTTVLFRAEPASARGLHFGSRLAFDRDGFLYISVGDRGQMNRAQDLGDHAGKIIRLSAEGRVPDDNPFLGQENARPEIFSYGHRNPQGLTVHPVTGQLWSHEHGPRGGDEINIVDPGLNYGWPVVTLGIDYTGLTIGQGLKTRPDMMDPLHHWTPSIAPSGMMFYTGKAFGRWEGDLFVGALAHRHLARLRLDGTRVIEEEKLLETMGRRIRDVRMAPDGSIWVLTDHDPGQVLRLDPLD